MSLSRLLCCLFLAAFLRPAHGRPSCMANNQRPCKLWERILFSDQRLVEDFLSSRCILKADYARHELAEKTLVHIGGFIIGKLGYADTAVIDRDVMRALENGQTTAILGPSTPGPLVSGPCRTTGCCAPLPSARWPGRVLSSSDPAAARARRPTWTTHARSWPMLRATSAGAGGGRWHRPWVLGLPHRQDRRRCLGG